MHVMSDDVGRHNIKIYEAFNKFSFPRKKAGQTVDTWQSAVECSLGFVWACQLKSVVS